MSVTEPNVIDNGRYTSTQAASILGIHINTLRAHSNSGNIKFGIRNSNGRRFYTGAEIKKFWKKEA